MDVEYKGKDTIIHNLKDFDLGQTMECGQCFHFQKIDDIDTIDFESLTNDTPREYVSISINTHKEKE